MTVREDTSPPVAVFLLITFVAAIGLAVAAQWSGTDRSPRETLALLAMLSPAFAVLVVRFALGARVAHVGWRRFPVRWLPVALLALPLAIHSIALPVTMVLEGRLPWQPWLRAASDGLFHTPPERGWGVLSATGLAGRIILNASLGLAVVSLLAFFEEVGWRAWLLPRFVARLGERHGAVASAGIWAAWHVPFALSGIQHIEGIPAVSLAMVMPLGHFGAGLFLAWLWLRTRSIAMVSLSHGSLNNWGQFAFKFLATSGRHDFTLLAGVNLALLCVGVLILPRLGASPRSPAAARQ